MANKGKRKQKITTPSKIRGGNQPTFKYKKEENISIPLVFN